MYDLENKIFRQFGLCGLAVLAKMLCMSLLTSRKRIVNGKFANKEDASLISEKTRPEDLRVRY
jgi:hypothetical protein